MRSTGDGVRSQDLREVMGSEALRSASMYIHIYTMTKTSKHFEHDSKLKTLESLDMYCVFIRFESLESLESLENEHLVAKKLRSVTNILSVSFVRGILHHTVCLPRCPFSKHFLTRSRSISLWPSQTRASQKWWGWCEASGV